MYTGQRNTDGGHNKRYNCNLFICLFMQPINYILHRNLILFKYLLQLFLVFPCFFQKFYQFVDFLCLLSKQSVLLLVLLRVLRKQTVMLRVLCRLLRKQPVLLLVPLRVLRKQAVMLRVFRRLLRK